MKIKYIAKKIYNKFEIYQLKKHSINDNLYLVNQSEKEIRTILFFFPDYLFMHLGDHLFFEPLARELCNKGYQVYVFPIKAMEFNFKQLGFVIGEKKPA